MLSAVKAGLLPNVIAGMTGPPLVSTPFVVSYVNDINRIIMTFVRQLSKIMLIETAIKSTLIILGKSLGQKRRIHR